MKFLLLSALVTVALAGPSTRLFDFGPAIVDDYQPAHVGPALVDEYKPVHVGPAIVEEDQPAHVEPALVDEDLTSAPVPVNSGSPLVQINVNINGDGRRALDDEQPAHVEPALVDDDSPVHVGPANVDEYKPTSVGSDNVQEYQSIKFGSNMDDKEQPTHVEPDFLRGFLTASPTINGNSNFQVQLQIVVNVNQDGYRNAAEVDQAPDATDENQSAHNEPTSVDDDRTSSPTPVNYNGPPLVQVHVNINKNSRSALVNGRPVRVNDQPAPVDDQPAHVEPALDDEHQSAQEPAFLRSDVITASPTITGNSNTQVQLKIRVNARQVGHRSQDEVTQAPESTEEEPVHVEPALVDEHHPIHVGPAMINEQSPAQVEPALRDSRLTASPTIVGNSITQIQRKVTVNGKLVRNAAEGEVVQAPESAEE